MGQVTWEADKMLDVYIYDYLVKRNLQETAKAFMAEGKVATDPVAIDAPGGFLFEWWSVFWDIFIARTNEKHSDVAAAYFETQQMKAKEQLKMQQYQLMQRQAAMLQRGDANRAALSGGASPAISGAGGGTNCDGILGSSAASSLAAKVYGEHLKNQNSVDSEALKSQSGHPGQSVQGQPGNMASALMQMQGRNQQTMIPQDIRPGLGGPQRSLAVDPSLYRQMLAQGKSGIGSGVGVNQGAGGPATLNGWPLSSERSGSQVHKPLMSSSNPYQLLSLQQQQLLGQGHVQGNVANSLGYGEIDPQRLRALQRAGLNVKDGQPTGIEGQVGSTMQPSSAMVRQDQMEYLMKVQQSPVHRPQEQLQQQYQLQQNPRKRKPTSSGAANSSGTGNTVGPSSTPPSTPSTNTPGDEVAMGSNLSHASNMPKSSMVYGTNGAGGLGSSPNQMDDLENLGDIGELEEHLASYLTNDDDAKFFAPSKNSSAEQNVQTSKALSVIGCNRTSNNKVLCCHFSSDGKLLASAGHEKKVLIWSMGNLQTVGLREEHALMITDIRFKPESTQLATSSFDKTVRLWNADEPSSSLHTFSGHSSQVTSLDFHPKKTDILCSCDDNGEIRLWDISERSGSFYSKGGLRQVRFQERIGQFLAAASDNVVSVFDFETKRKIRVLQGHSKEVQSICWNPSGEYLASVSHDVIKVWSFPSGECIHELRSNGSNFQSCVFHLGSPGILVIGGYQSLQVWDMLAKKTITESAAHEGLITALATSATGAIASASHDKTTRLWKLVGQIQI